MIELIPLLQTQRDIYNLPRGFERFRTYLDTLTDEEGDMDLPLSAMNPMGHEHNAKLLDALLEMNAEKAAAQAVAEANHRLAAVNPDSQLPDLRVALVVVDDLRGQWTNRYFTEASHRFDSRGTTRRGWATVFCWASEVWTYAKIEQEALASIYRTFYIIMHGYPKRLEQMLIQEGLAMQFAHMTPPPLEADDLEYSQEVIRPYLSTDEFPKIFSVLYGDDAARTAGYQPIGLSERAGFAVALRMAQQTDIKPEQALKARS